VKRPELIVYLSPSHNPQDPALAHRARAILALKLSGKKWTWACPYCGSKAQGTLKLGCWQAIDLPHQPWCPVVADSGEDTEGER
jgi:hypothetical protein